MSNRAEAVTEFMSVLEVFLFSDDSTNFDIFMKLSQECTLTNKTLSFSVQSPRRLAVLGTFFQILQEIVETVMRSSTDSLGE